MKRKRAETISRLINKSFERTLIFNYFDNWFIVSQSVIFYTAYP